MGISASQVKELRDRTDAPMKECKLALEEAGGDLDKAIKVLRERGITKAAKRADRATSEGVVRVRTGAGNQGGTAVMLACETDFSARNETFQKLADTLVEAASACAPGEPAADALLGATSGGRPVRATFEDVANTIRENIVIRRAVRFGGICGSYQHFDGRSAALVEVEGGDGGAGLAGILRELCMHIVSTVPAPLAVDAKEIPQSEIDQEKEIYIKQAMDSGKPREIAEKMVAGRLKKFLSERALLEQPFVKNPDQTVAAWLGQAAKTLGLAALRVTRFARLKFGE